MYYYIAINAGRSDIQLSKHLLTVIEKCLEHIQLNTEHLDVVSLLDIYRFAKTCCFFH